jgi:hypothetical protein
MWQPNGLNNYVLKTFATYNMIGECPMDAKEHLETKFLHCGPSDKRALAHPRYFQQSLTNGNPKQ